MTVSPLHGAGSAPEDFEDFYRQYYVRVLVLIRRHFPTCDAEEIAQETMTRCFANFDSLDPQRDAWKWVSSVGRNAAIDSIRRGRKLLSTEDLPERVELVDSTYEAAVVAERRSTVRAALHRLRPADRQLLEDHEIEGIACGEMAAVRDIAPNALRQQLHRAKGRFATELRRAGAGLSVVPVALHARVDRLVRRANELGTAAGPVAASAIGVIAVAGVTGAASVFGGGGAAVPYAASGLGTDVVSTAADHTRATSRFDAGRAPIGLRPDGPPRPSVPPPPTPPPLEPVPGVTIATRGNPAQNPQEESGADIIVDTPLGPVEHHHSMGWLPGQGVLCWAEVTTCPPDEEGEDPEEPPGR